MKNIRIDPRSSRDIDERIERIHRDVGYVDGKVSLPHIRDLLNLDLKYYQVNNPDLLDEVVHKLKVGAKQVIARPMLLVDAVKKFDLNALFVPDRKRILIDAEVPDPKKRWCEGHEVAHSIIPWHEDYMHGDDRTTLSQGCHELIEAEANYGSGRILFPKVRFSDACNSSPLTLAHVRSLAKHFGNTITSTLWRCVEQSNETSFAVIGEHPHHMREGKLPIEYLIQSELFEKQFSRIGEQVIWESIKSYCAHKKTGPLGSLEIVLNDDNDNAHVFLIESFSNGYNTLTLAKKMRCVQLIVASVGELKTL